MEKYIDGYKKALEGLKERKIESIHFIIDGEEVSVNFSTGQMTRREVGLCDPDCWIAGGGEDEFFIQVEGLNISFE